MHQKIDYLFVAALFLAFSSGLAVQAENSDKPIKCDVVTRTSVVSTESTSLKESVADKLAKMKPAGVAKQAKIPNTASILLYTVEGEVLDGKPAAICDIQNCRIAILGADISKVEKAIKKLNLRVAGSEAEDQQIKDTQEKVFFSSKYRSTNKGKKAKCRFHNFEFDLTDRLLSYGTQKPVIGHSRGTLWANPTNVGILILVDASNGKFTTHAMKPNSKRIVLSESQNPAS